MRLYNYLDRLCDSYSIPITESTIGYLQFYSELAVPNADDIISIKCYIVDVITGVETQTTALNTIAQYLDNNTFRMLIQGFNNIPESFKFRFKIVVKTNAATSPNLTLYSDLFSYLKCDISYPVIPCLVGNQEYSSYGAFLGEIEGNIVYRSWHTNEPKKYTPVIFLRNVSFNKKTSTIEYKKLNNKPLKSTLKKNYNLICEPVSSNYSEYIMDIFGFGKVNILGTTYAFDTYSDEIIDEKDCCSLYKITATAYIETQLRLQCSNNCVVLSPIDCSDYTSPSTSCSPPIGLSVESNGSNLEINILNNVNSIYRIRYKKATDISFNTDYTSSFPYVITNTEPNTEYIIEVHNLCGDKITKRIKTMPKREYGTFDIGDLDEAQNLTGYIASVTRTQLNPNPQNVRYVITFTQPYDTIEYSPIINLYSLSSVTANASVVHAIENKTVNGFELLMREYANEVQNLSVIIQII